MAECLLTTDERPCLEPLHGLLCGIHANQLRIALRQLPTHATQVLAHTGRATGQATERVSSSPEPVLPAAAWLSIVGPTAEEGRVSGQRSQSERLEPEPATVVDTLISWMLLISEERNVYPPPIGRTIAGIRVACDWLAGQLEWIITRDWCAEMQDEITTDWRAVRSKAGDNPQPKKGLVPCPACLQRAMWQEEPGVPIDGRIVGGEYRCLKRDDGCGCIEPEDQHYARWVAVDQAATKARGKRSDYADRPEHHIHAALCGKMDEHDAHELDDGAVCDGTRIRTGGWRQAG